MFWEKINKHSNLVSVFLGLGLVILLWVMINANAATSHSSMGYSSDTVIARVNQIVEVGDIQLGEVTQKYQIVKVEILEGEHSNDFFTVEYGKRSILSTEKLLKLNDRIMVMITTMPDGDINASFIDYVRTESLTVLGILFILACIVVSGWKGIRSLVATGLSILVILFFIVPQINAGKNPVLISLIGSFVFLTLSQYLVYGWTMKTHLSLAGILFSIAIMGVLAGVFVNYAQLNGTGDESAIYLLQLPGQINIKNLLIAGIIIGSLGIMDDLIVGQTSVVIEIFRANPNLSLHERFSRAMNVGRDHIAATVNTLVFAYLGASLPLFLLFSLGNANFIILLNQSILAEEVVRTLVGTIGLFLAVPVSTFLACWAFDNPNRLAKMVTFFGPLLNPSEVNEEGHHH
jgi:uncharacterized membrane protein